MGVYGDVPARRSSRTRAGLAFGFDQLVLDLLDRGDYPASVRVRRVLARHRPPRGLRRGQPHVRRSSADPAARRATEGARYEVACCCSARPGFLGAHVRRALGDDPRVTRSICPGPRPVRPARRRTSTGLAALLRDAGPDAVVNCTGRLAGTGVRPGAGATRWSRRSSSRRWRDGRPGRPAGAARLGRRVRRRCRTARRSPRTTRRAPVSEYGVSHLAATRLLELASAAGPGRRRDAARVQPDRRRACTRTNLLGRAAALIAAALAAGDGVDHAGPARRRTATSSTCATWRRGASPSVTAGGPAGAGVQRRQRRAVTAARRSSCSPSVAGFTGEIRERAPARRGRPRWTGCWPTSAGPHAVLGWRAGARPGRLASRTIWAGPAGS